MTSNNKTYLDRFPAAAGIVGIFSAVALVVKAAFPSQMTTAYSPLSFFIFL